MSSTMNLTPERKAVIRSQVDAALGAAKAGLTVWVPVLDQQEAAFARSCLEKRHGAKNVVVLTEAEAIEIERKAEAAILADEEETARRRKESEQ